MEASIEAVDGPEFTEKVAVVQPKSDHRVKDSNTENAKLYRYEIPSNPMALLATAAVGPQSPNAPSLLSLAVKL